MKMFTNPQNKVKEENSNCIQLQEKKNNTQQYQQRDIWVWIFLLRLPSEKAVPLEQQYSNNWITWDNSSCEGCGEATSQDERALDHWTLGNLITSLLNAKGQKRQLCRILNATKNKNNVLLHWGKKKKRNLLHIAYGSFPQSTWQEEFKQVAQLCKTERGILRKLKPTWFLNRRQHFLTDVVKTDRQGKNCLPKTNQQEGKLENAGHLFRVLVRPGL